MTVTLYGVSPPLGTATASIVGTVASGTIPSISPGGVVNAFDRQAGGPLGLGTVVEIYGTAFGSGSQSGNIIGGMLLTNINGISVTVDGVAAPLYYASSGQIDAQIPLELQPNQQYQLIVSANGRLSRSETIMTVAAQPGLAANADGTVIAQDANYKLITPQSPAHAGQVVILYLTGMGATSPAVSTGQQAPSSPPAQVTQKPQVLIDGAPANVIFAGLSPGSVGLYQIDVQVPTNARSGGLPIVVLQGTATSNSATIPVQ